MPKAGYTSYSDEKYHSAFATILREELIPTAEKAKELAEKLGVSIQAVNQYKQGQGFPKTENLVNIARHFNVSLDYLVGLSDVSTPDASIQAIAEYTGLSQRAIELLHSSTGVFPFVTAINRILESGMSGISLLISIEDYLNTDESVRYDMTKYHDDFTATDSIPANTIQLLEIQERLRKIKGGLK